MITEDELKVGVRLVPVAKITDIPNGWIIRVNAGVRVLAIANRGGTFHAIDGMCSHAGGPLGDARLRDGCMVECPWHGAKFDVRTGEACGAPARSPQTTYDVHVEGDTIYVAIEEPSRDRRVAISE